MKRTLNYNKGDMLGTIRSISLSVFQNSELLILLFLSALILLMMQGLRPFLKEDAPVPEPRPLSEHLSFLRRTRASVSLSRTDRWFLYTVLLIYGLVSFYRLGSHSMPVTTWQPSVSGQTVIFELPEKTSFDRIIAFYGEGDNNSRSYGYQLGFHDIVLEGSSDRQTWQPVTVLTEGSIYRYLSFYGYWDYRYIRLTSNDDSDTVTELAFVNNAQNEILPVTICEDSRQDGPYPAERMIDEQDRIVLDPTWYDESYFDEVYHPRNAWEIANGQYMYATVHPLLGTELIALSVRLFGMNPFAWRLPGALFGIAMLGVLFHLLCLLFQDHRYARLGVFLFAVEFMHLTTSRIATLEPMSVFFILLMFDRMVQYCRMSFFDHSFRDTLLVLLRCGIDMSLAIAVKWTGCYSAVGLAVLFFSVLLMRAAEYRAACRLSAETVASMDETSRAVLKQVKRYPEYLLKTLLWAVFFFLLIPLTIYYLVYLPAPFSRNGHSLSSVVEQTLYIYRYHIGLDATHPYQSTWKQWLIDGRPIWYYGRMDQNGVYHTIACFTNPLISAAGLAALPITFWRMVCRKAFTAFLILVGFCTALVPWMLVDRCVFAYHFYPTSVFLILIIVCAFETLSPILPKPELWHRGFAVLALLLFVIYLPVLTGFGTRLDYVHLLEVFPSWYFG